VNRPFIVGLTGGIGSGKSAAMKLFMARGVPCIDADNVAREVVEPGQPALNAIVKRYGKDCLLSSGALDRSGLRKKMFASEAEKLWLEALLHPIINENICQWLDSQSEPYAILCSPLLLESKQHELVDRILLIDVPEPLQISRTIARDGNTEQQVEKIISSQMSRPLKRQRADDIIVNDKSLEHLETEVETLHIAYLILAKKHQRYD